MRDDKNNEKQLQRNILMRRIGVIGWTSFTSAAVATMVFFSMFDPLTLGDVTTWPVKLTRLEGYSMGFLLFWILISVSSSAVVFLLALPSYKLSRPLLKDEALTGKAVEETVVKEKVVKDTE